mgnify:CR=1 FL=1
MVGFTGSFNAKTAATTGSRKSSVFQGVPEIVAGEMPRSVLD